MSEPIESDRMKIFKFSFAIVYENIIPVLTGPAPCYKALCCCLLMNFIIICNSMIDVIPIG